MPPTRPAPILASLFVFACTGAPPLDDGQTTTSQGTDEIGTDEIGTDDAEASDATTDDPDALVIVVELYGFYLPPQPGAGAKVALDTSEGRVEVVADADGRAVFEGFAWAGQAVDVTVGLADWPLRSHLGVAEADLDDEGEFTVELLRDWKRTDGVEVFGTAVGGDPAHYLIVGASRAWGYSGPLEDWMIRAAPGQPFRLVALEIDYLDAGPRNTANPIFNWFTLEHPAIEEQTEVLVDFASPTQPTSVQGSFALPSRPESPLRADTFGFVYTYDDTSLLTGRSITTSITPDGDRCDFEVEYVTVDGLVNPRTCHRLIQPPDYDFTSTACVPGLPSGGAVDIELLDTVELPDLPAPRDLHDPIEFAIFDADVVPNLIITQDQALLWRVSGPVDATTLTVPAPPSGFEAPAGVILDANLQLHRDHPSEGYLQYFSTSQMFELET